MQYLNDVIETQDYSEEVVLTPAGDYSAPLYPNATLLDMKEADQMDFAIYQSGCTNNFSKQRLQEMQILDTLRQLKFPMQEEGTYLFKCMIVKAIHHLDGFDDFGEPISEYGLLEQMKSAYSQFYMDTSRNDLDLGIKTFHAFVARAFSRVNYAYVDDALLSEVYGDFSREADCGQHAFIIAKYIRDTYGKGSSSEKNEVGYQYVKQAVMVSAIAQV